MSIRHPDPTEAHTIPGKLLLHSGGGTPDGPYMIKSRGLEDCRYWGEPTRGYSGVPHNNANRKKKAKRKQAQASRRNNRR